MVSRRDLLKVGATTTGSIALGGVIPRPRKPSGLHVRVVHSERHGDGLLLTWEVEGLHGL